MIFEAQSQLLTITFNLLQLFMKDISYFFLRVSPSPHSLQKTITQNYQYDTMFTIAMSTALFVTAYPNC